VIPPTETGRKSTVVATRAMRQENCKMNNIHIITDADGTHVVAEYLASVESGECHDK